MSERSSISLSEVLGDNYYIDKLTSSDYSPSVGDTVTITLMVKDVFGDPANGQTRTVTCTSGQFVSMNGTSITATDSVSVTTGSGGTVTLGLSVNVADTITVSSGMADCVVSSLSDFFEDNTFTSFWTDGSVNMLVNKAIGIAYLQFNKNVTVSANNSTVVHSAYASNAAEVQYCPPTATYAPTGTKDVFLYVSYLGEIRVYNRSSSAISNTNVQGMVMWRAKGYPE